MVVSRCRRIPFEKTALAAVAGHGARLVCSVDFAEGVVLAVGDGDEGGEALGEGWGEAG